MLASIRSTTVTCPPGDVVGVDVTVVGVDVAVGVVSVEVGVDVVVADVVNVDVVEAVPVVAVVPDVVIVLVVVAEVVAEESTRRIRPLSRCRWSPGPQAPSASVSAMHVSSHSQ